MVEFDLFPNKKRQYKHLKNNEYGNYWSCLPRNYTFHVRGWTIHFVLGASHLRFMLVTQRLTERGGKPGSYTKKLKEVTRDTAESLYM